MTELDDLADEVAALLGCPCTIEDADFNLIAYSGQSNVDQVRQRSILERRATREIRDWFHGQGIRESATPVRTPAEPALGIDSRVCFPARHLGRIHGYIWLLDPGETIAPDSWSAVEHIADVAALLLSQSSRRQTRQNLFFRDLVDGDPASAASAAHALAAAAGMNTATPVTCMVVSHGDGERGPALTPRSDRALWFEDSAQLEAVVVRGGFDVDDDAPSLLERLGSPRTRRALDRAARVGVGPTVDSIRSIRRSRWGALTALRVAAHDGSAIAYWDRLGPLRLLGSTADSDLADALHTPRLVEFLADPRNRDLVRTAQTYLDNAGSISRTTDALGLHRQTLYYRLSRVEKQTGLTLKSGRDRLLLHLALAINPYLDPP
jgi:hypothetical protein